MQVCCQTQIRLVRNSEFTSSESFLSKNPRIVNPPLFTQSLRMKTFLPTAPMVSLSPMVSVSTQTDGCVEVGYQALCGSSSMAAAIDIYDWEEEDETGSADLTSNRLHATSSQTDLALSDFDLSRCLEWEDEDDEEEEEEEEEEENQHEIHEDYEDNVYNSTEDHHTATTEEQACQAGLNLCGSNIFEGSPAYEPLFKKSSQTELVSKDIAPLNYQANLKPAEKCFIKGLVTRTCRPMKGFHGIGILVGKMAEVQLNENIQGSYSQETIHQKQFCIRNRMVPRMGTKVEFLKHVSCHQGVQMPGSCHLPALSSKTIFKTGAKFDRQVIDFFKNNTEEDFILNGYHSDSEHSYASIQENGHLKDWSSDGDADSISQTFCDDLGQSFNILNTELLSPESRSKVETLRHTYEQFADIMYTNQANLQHTIMVQQRLFKQQLATRQLQDELTNKRSVNPSGIWLSAKALAETSNNECKTQHQSDTSWGQCKSWKKSHLEWIVKRRPDGTRYITRRPVRGKLLKQRAKQLAAQHENLLTTDDDTASEVKIGRYWSKEERKRHLEKSRNLKRQKENQMKIHASSIKEEATKHVGSTNAQPHKLSKQQSRKILENFSTLKDLMLQRGADNKGKGFSPLLSVTTI